MLRTQLQSFRGQTSGTYETKTFLGQEYMVVPVVAMVEGVRFGANQDSAELGLASEFGKFVEGWNNSPIVLGHPQIEGNFVSASGPSVLETYQIGFMSATQVQNKKLKAEAWIAVNQLGKSDAAKSVATRVQAGTMIEVSVGFFTDVEDSTGTYDNQDYTGVWRNIVPDHLAFLEEGVLGACSIADGCGTPRVNSKAKVDKMGLFRTDASKKKKAKMKQDVTRYMKPKDATAVATQAAECSCHDEVVAQTEPVVFSAITELESLTTADVAAMQRFAVHMLPDGVLSTDIRNALSRAISDAYGYCYLYGFTASTAVFEIYDEMSGSFDLYQQAFDMDADGNVTFTGDAEEVRLITKIIPVGSADGDDVTTNEISTQETTMAKTPEEIAAEAAVTATASTQAATTTTTVETAPAVQTVVKALTAAEYVANAPAEIREVLDASMKVHAARKESLITNIEKSGRNTFTADYLKSQSLETLEGLAKLAAVPTDFSGQAIPTSRAQAADDEKVPAAPVALVRKTQA